jgi:hypothetical protein
MTPEVVMNSQLAKNVAFAGAQTLSRSRENIAGGIVAGQRWVEPSQTSVRPHRSPSCKVLEHPTIDHPANVSATV